ncbi:MAG TPA: sugar transferase, partial [Gemmatimonadales bacterium]|nr:sugar transferase [Gemmatimonadales bacterium]
MEGLIERTEAQDARRRLQTVWSADDGRIPDREARWPAEPVRQQWATRVLNFVLASLALVSLLPVMLVIAVLIKLTSRGPVFYLQERVGLDRRQRGVGALNHRRSHDAG